MDAVALRMGVVYFGLSYEDEDHALPIVTTYVYLGQDIYGQPTTEKGKRFFFRYIGSEDSLELSDGQLDLILDARSLAEALRKWESE